MRVASADAAFVLAILAVAVASGQQPVASDALARVRSEGLERSQARKLLHTLTDEIGGRLTGSPSHLQAAGWARDASRTGSCPTRGWSRSTSGAAAAGKSPMSPWTCLKLAFP